MSPLPCGVNQAPEVEEWEPGTGYPPPPTVGGPWGFNDLKPEIQSVIGYSYYGFFAKAIDIPGDIGGKAIDETAFGGECRKAVADGSSGLMVNGPYFDDLAAGVYWAIFRLKVASNASSSPVCTIRVVVTREGGSTTISSRTIRPIDFEDSNKWQSFSMVSEIRHNDTRLAFQISFVSGVTDLSCDVIRLWPLGHVSTELIENLAVTNAKIADLAVTNAKIADLSASKITAGTLTVAITTGAGGQIQTGAGTSRLELGTAGISAFNAGTQRVAINSDGSGWLGSSADFSWTSAGTLSVNGAIIQDLTVTNAKIASVSASKLLAGTITVAIDAGTGGTIRTGATTARVELGTAGIRAFDSAGAQRVAINSDGSGWFGSSAAFSWTSGGSVSIDGANIKDLTVSNAKIAACSIGKLIAGTLTAGVWGTLTSTSGFRSGATGARIEITGEYVRGYDSGGVTQFELRSSDGKATVGAGSVTMDSAGITIAGGYLTYRATIGAGNWGRWQFSDTAGLFYSSSIARIDIGTPGVVSLGLGAGATFGVRGTTPVYLFFNTYDGLGSGGALHHKYVPSVTNHGYLGDTSYYWHRVYCGQLLYKTAPASFACPEIFKTVDDIRKLTDVDRDKQIKGKGKGSSKGNGNGKKPLKIVYKVPRVFHHSAYDVKDKIRDRLGINVNPLERELYSMLLKKHKDDYGKVKEDLDTFSLGEPGAFSDLIKLCDEQVGVYDELPLQEFIDEYGEELVAEALEILRTELGPLIEIEYEGG